MADIKGMTLHQFKKSLEAIDKRIRITTDDLYQDEVTPEGEMRILGKLFGGNIGSK